MSTDLDQFQNLLREVFQFDHADLDFGIYRILNRKRDQIETFIQDELVKEISTQVERLDTVETQDVEERFLEAREKVVNTFSEEALGKDDELVEYQETPLGEEYMEIWEEWHQAQEQSESKEQVRRQIYDHLYRFFRRYYDDGDFVTKRRFSAGESKYAIPYDGEEVKLHWANRDQYYVKTSERFTDYRFNADDYHVHFKLVSADTPTDNTKGDTRYFIPFGGETVTIDEEESTITIRFEYRPISDEEEDHYLEIYNDLPGKTYRTLSQGRLCEALESILMDKIEDPDVQSELARVDAQTEKSLLLTHLNRYTARNTSDYFIHKDLGGFLKGQLDYFIKSEVLHLEDVIGDAGEGALQQARVQADVVKTIGEKIIDFLAQIEDFQKRLFEKKKFVVQTDYCITVDQVPEELYDEILENEAQLAEWRELYAVDEWEQSLEWNGSFDEAFLGTHPHAMIDTAHFDQAFKDQLLDSFEDLEDLTDGLLVHGENFQALNLLQEKYAETVDCVYIDPPYNTGNRDFLYKDNYRHSSWVSMMADRVELARNLMRQESALFANVDDNEQDNLRKLLEEAFGVENFVANIIWEKKYARQNDATWFSTSHDFILTTARNKERWRPGRVPRTEKQNQHYKNRDGDPRGKWQSVVYTCAKTADQRPNLYYPIEHPKTGEEIWPSRDRVWAFDQEAHQQNVEEDRLWWGENQEKEKPRLKVFLKDMSGNVPTTIWSREEVGDNQLAVRQLQGLFEECPFPSPKPSKLVRRVIQVGSGNTVLDYFAGSGSTGQAVVEMNKDEEVEGTDREYILIEMGRSFDTVLKPRMKKVSFTEDWEDGQPESRQGQTHCFKYHRLESYEDTLNNLEVDEPDGPQKKLLYEEMDDYVLQYMLEHETNGSPSLLAEEAFTHPFDYTLQIKEDGESPEPTKVDLVETFHYLIGMAVQEYTTAEHQGRRYVSTRGTVETSTGIDEVRCIWRDTEEPDALNLEEEATWAEENLLAETPADRIYVNGTTQIPGTKPVEIPFRDRMG